MTDAEDSDDEVDVDLDKEPVASLDETDATEEPEQQPDETESPRDEDPYPSGTPQATRRRAASYITRLNEIGVTVQQITPQHIPPEDAEEGDNLDEDDLELESVVLRCRFNNDFFAIVLPLDEQFVLFQTDYDLLEDMVFTSESVHLGGDFDALNPQQRWGAYQRFRDNVASEQIIGLCRANRSVAIPQLDAWLAILSTNGNRFIIDTSRVSFEYIGGTVQRREYRPAMEIKTQELHELIMQLLSLRRGVQFILGGAYLSNGVQVPDNFESLEEAFEEARQEQTNQAQNRGPSFRGYQ